MSKKEQLKIVLPPVVALCYNSLVYWGAPFLAAGRKAHDLTVSLDASVPFVPAMVIVYFGCYLFWAVNYVIMAFQEETCRYQFFTAEILAKTVCFLFFVFYPTTNVRPELTGNSIWIRCMMLLYAVDKPVNLFPSIHCLVSWFSCIGLKRCPKVPAWYRWASYGMALLVFFSTLATRQHVLWDVVGGVAVAEIMWLISCRTKVWKPYQKAIEGIADKLSKRIERLNHGKQKEDAV